MDRSEVRDISQREALIIELVYELSKYTNEQDGCSLEEIVEFLQTPVKHKDYRTALECLEDEGHDFIKEVVDFVNGSNEP